MPITIKPLDQDIIKSCLDDILEDTNRNNYEGAAKLAQELSNYFYRITEKVRKSELTQSLQKAVHRDNTTAIVIWGQDCDLAENTRITYIKPVVEEYDELEQHIADSAEGPYMLTILTPEETAYFKPMFRDRAAEMAGY